MFSDSYEKFGPEFAIDNIVIDENNSSVKTWKIVTTGERVFLSKAESFPWFQWNINERKGMIVTGLKIQFAAECEDVNRSPASKKVKMSKEAEKESASANVVRRRKSIGR